MKFGAWMILLWLCLIALASRAHAESVTVSWEAPTKNTDNTPLTDLSGYRFYTGKGPTEAELTYVLLPKDVTSYTVSDLAPGKWYFAVKSVTPTAKSDLSSVISETVEVGPACGPAPPVESKTNICPLPSIGNWQQTRTYVSAPFPQCWSAGPWIPTEAAAGVCSLPALLTAGPLSYERRGTASAPTMVAIGLVPAGLPCGPTVQLVGNVKYCAITRAQTDIVNWPTDLKAQAIWARSQ